MGMEGFAGGLFWDGRATGWSLGDPLAEQARGPFLNPLEQNNPNAKLVCLNVLRTDYASLFEQVWGADSLNCVKDVNGTYERIARSIAAYERSAEVNPFSSRFDLFWKNWKQARAEGKQIPPVHNIAW
jgi:cytochrome c peroxidase